MLRPAQAPGERLTWAAVALRALTTRGPVAIIVTVLLLAGVTVAVYLLGGTHSAAPHLYYVPIIYAVATLGSVGGLATAVAAGGLAALEPIDTATGAPQTVLTAGLRTVLFVAVAGGVIGAHSARRRMDSEAEFSDIRRRLAGPLGPEAGPLIGPAEIRAAIDRSQYTIVYQPIYSLHTGDLVSVEALTRFTGPRGGSPEAWFRAAARHGLGPDLDIAVIETAIARCHVLPSGARLAVNVGPATLGDGRLAGIAARAHGRIPLTLEITENAAIENYAEVESTLEMLRRFDVRIAVDDAGAGFASLRHVLRLRPEVIKIDRMLAAEIARSPARQALGRTLIEFGHQSGAYVVIEGVESVPDLQAWRDLGADTVQGYLTGRPSPDPAPHVSDEVLRVLPRHERVEPRPVDPTGGVERTAAPIRQSGVEA